MADQRIVSFIQSALQKGNSRTQIEQVLLQKGWPAAQVQEAFASLGAPKTAATAAAKAKVPLWKNKLFLILAGLVVLLFTVVAVIVLTGPECERDADCDSGFACEDGSCVVEEVECRSDRECSVGEECQSGTCITVAEEPECTSDSQCPSGFICEAEECVLAPECTSDLDCSPGFACELNACVEEKQVTAVAGGENYEIVSVALSSLSTSTSVFSLNVTNSGTADSVSDLSLDCVLSGSLREGHYLAADESVVVTLTDGSTHTITLVDVLTGSVVIEIDGSQLEITSLGTSQSIGGVDVTVVAIYYRTEREESLAHIFVGSEVEVPQEVSASTSVAITGLAAKSSILTSCSPGASDFYALLERYYFLEDVNEINVTLSATVDADDNISESNELDNEFIFEDSWNLSDFAVYFECRTSDQCGSGSICDAGTCVATEAAALGLPCTTDSDCSSGHCSSGGACVECVATSDCDPGYVCDSTGTCIVGVEDCFDGVDNDNDGAADQADTDCAGAVPTGAVCTDVLPECGDGVDNDGDGSVDIADSGCGGIWENVSELTVAATVPSAGPGIGITLPLGIRTVTILEAGSQCSDAKDNDHDGRYDIYGACNISGVVYNCESLPVGQPYDTESCYGGCISSFNNGEYLPNDVQCSDKNDTEEAVCGDGVCDHFEEDCAIDCGCAQSSDCGEGYECVTDECVELVDCNDGQDNDADGLRDYLGVCEIDGVPRSCTNYHRIYGITDSASCSRVCSSYSTGIYYGSDLDCGRATDRSERTGILSGGVQISSGLQGLMAPEEEKGFFVRFVDFLIQSPSSASDFVFQYAFLF